MPRLSRERRGFLLLTLYRTYLALLVMLSFAAYAHEVPSWCGDSSRVETADGPDSAAMRAYSLQEILVTATRLPQTAALSASPVTVLSKAELGQMNAVSLADLLGPLPGLFVKDYGGWSGLKTIAQRGLGAEHTVVLINGMRVSNVQNGLVDLGLIAADELDRLEVVRGGQSASFGADAVAGVVNAVLSPVTRELSVRAASDIGSFGYRRYWVSGSGEVTDGVGVRAAFREEKGDENFPFLFRNGSEQIELTRQNADFRSRLATVQSDFLVNDAVQLWVCGRTFSAERGVGGPVVGPASFSVARQKDEDHLLQAAFRSPPSDDAPRFHYRIGFQFHHSYQRYEDRAFLVGGTPLDNFYKTTDVRLEPTMDFALSDRTRIALGSEFSRTTGVGNFLGSDVRRISYAGYAALQQQVGTEGPIVRNMLLYPALRYDAVRTEGEIITSWSPQLGTVISFQEVGGVIQMSLRASVSRNFRAPTFNELFYAGGGGIGNPHLQPERSTSIDVGMDVRLSLAGTHHLQCTYFDIAMRNRIVWVPAGSFTVMPKNLRSVRSRGVEVAYKWTTLDERLTFGMSYTSLAARKTQPDSPGDPNANAYLIYVPQEQAHYSIAFRHEFEGSFVRELEAAVAASYVGFRFTSEDNRSFLPSYTIADANLNVRMRITDVSLLLRVEVNNLLNNDYQSVPAYPMPLRSYRATLGVEL